MPGGDIQLFQPPSDAPGNSGKKGIVDYPQPWLDYASTILPNSLSMVLRWAEFIWMSNGTYRQACQRTARYFITDLLIGDVDDEQAEEIKGIFEDDLKIIQQLSNVGDAFLNYGNIFLHLNLPFDRFLRCDCGFFLPFDEAVDKKLYEWKGGKFMKTKGCPQCGQKHPGPWHLMDKESKRVNDLRINIMNPHEMEMGFNPYSQRKKYYWNIPAIIVSGIKEGVPIIIRDMPEEIIDCVMDGKTQFEFDDDVIFHAGDAAPAGIYTGGWGLPRVISNFRLAFHYQVLNRFDQAIAMDYINGMRVISPEQNSGGNGAGDPLVGVGGSQFSANIHRMIEEHRKDPNTWNTSPIPLQYQLFGGEGQQLSPTDLMRAKLDEWLDATGIPHELFHGTLNITSAPIALRIFENSWPEVVSLYNNVLEWIGGYMVKVLNVPDFSIELLRVKLADDMERRQIMLQLMAGNQVSPQTALSAFGINDPREELRRSFDWQKMTAEEEKKFTEDMEQQAKADQIKQEWADRSAGLPPPGAPPGPGGPGGGMMDPAAMGMGGGQMNPDALSTPESMDGEAQRLAEEINGMDATMRRSTLINLKKQNETLHALVKSKLATMEQNAKTQGVAMLRQQGQMAQA